MSNKFVTDDVAREMVERLVEMMDERTQLATGSSQYSQITELNVTAPKIIDIPIENTESFNRPPLEILKLTEGSDSVITSCSFIDSNSNDFTYNTSYVLFNDGITLNTSYSINMSNIIAEGDGFYSVSDVIDSSNFKDIAISFTGHNSAKQTYSTASVGVGIRLVSPIEGPYYADPDSSLHKDAGNWERVSESFDISDTLISSSVTEAAPYKLMLLANGKKYNTSGEEITDFSNADNKLPTFSVLKTLGTFQVAYFSYSDSQPVCTMSAVPNNQFIRPVSLITLPSDTSIASITVDNIKGLFSDVRIFVTPDLINFYNYIDGTWRIVDYFSDTGLTSERISVIPASAWNELTSSKTIAFAFTLLAMFTDDIPAVNKLTIRADFAGNWSKATHNLDYTYSYTSNTNLRLSLLSNGNFKINYLRGESNA